MAMGTIGIVAEIAHGLWTDRTPRVFGNLGWEVQSIDAQAPLARIDAGLSEGVEHSMVVWRFFPYALWRARDEFENCQRYSARECLSRSQA